MASLAPITIHLDLPSARRILRDLCASPSTWDAVAARIGEHPYQYDLADLSERLDVVQIVCEAFGKVLHDALGGAA